MEKVLNIRSLFEQTRLGRIELKSDQITIRQGQTRVDCFYFKATPVSTISKWFTLIQFF